MIVQASALKAGSVIPIYVTVSAKTLHVSMQILAYFSELEIS